MTFFTQDEIPSLIESVSGIMAQRQAGMNLPEMVREAAIEAGKACVGKGLEERRHIMHNFFNASSAQAQAKENSFRPTNETVLQFNEVAINSLNHHEAALAAGSFEDVADDPGSPLTDEDRARLNKRKTNEDAEGAGSFEDVAKSKGSPLQSDQKALLNKRKVKEGAEGAGSFEDVADDEGSPLSAEDRARLQKRKVREAAVSHIENLSNFGDKKAKKFPDDKDGDGKVDEAKGKFPDFLKKNGKDEDEDGKVNEEDSTGTDKEVEDVDADERKVSVKAKTVRDIDSVPVSKTHSFVSESWTILVNVEGLELGQQHLLAAKLAAEDDISEACASCPSNQSPFSVTVKGDTEIEAVENLVSAFENIGSQFTEDNVLVAHRTPSTG